MKIVYPVCCGIDVHKSFLVATIVSVTDLRTLKHKKERFSTFNKDLKRLKHWLIENNCYDVCMESTGKYWVPVLNVLEPELRVVIVNPKWVKAIKGNKDDVKDSKWIGELFCFGLVRSSFIPEKPSASCENSRDTATSSSICAAARKTASRTALPSATSPWMLWYRICSASPHLSSRTIS